MSTDLEQLRIAYETLQMSPEEIAESQDLDLVSVKAGLMQCSPRYRKDCGQEDTKETRLNFSDIDLEQVNANLMRLALYSEDERLQFQACCYIRDDKKGRKDVVKQMGNTTFNLIQFNESLRAMREQAAAAKSVILASNTPQQKAIEA